MAKSKSALWRQLNPDAARVQRRRRGVAQYDITEAEWVLLWRGQGGECPICGAKLRNKFDPKSSGKVAAVDHDHAVERTKGIRASVRGLLCNFPCNRFLTKFWTPDFLRRAAEYQESPPARRILLLAKATNAPSS